MLCLHTDPLRKTPPRFARKVSGLTMKSLRSSSFGFSYLTQTLQCIDCTGKEISPGTKHYQSSDLTISSILN